MSIRLASRYVTLLRRYVRHADAARLLLAILRFRRRLLLMALTRHAADY